MCSLPFPPLNHRMVRHPRGHIMRLLREKKRRKRKRGKGEKGKGEEIYGRGEREKGQTPGGTMEC